jgi:hypothetical protein
MESPLDRLIALDEQRVWASIVRGRDQRGRGVVRSGVLRLVLPPDALRRTVELRSDEPIAQIYDDAGLPLVSLLGTDTFTMFTNNLLSAQLRTTLRVDILDRPFRSAYDDFVPMSYERASRMLAAELEAAFRSLLLFRPDPDPDPDVRPRVLPGIPPASTGPLQDGSIRFAVGHVAVTLHPDDGGMLMRCILSEVKFDWQRVHVFRPIKGEHYALDEAAIEELGSDIRSFLCEQADRFEVVTTGTEPPPNDIDDLIGPP